MAAFPAVLALSPLHVAAADSLYTVRMVYATEASVKGNRSRVVTHNEIAANATISTSPLCRAEGHQRGAHCGGRN